MKTERQLWAEAGVAYWLDFFAEALGRLSDCDAYEYPERFSCAGAARANVELAFNMLKRIEWYRTPHALRTTVHAYNMPGW